MVQLPEVTTETSTRQNRHSSNDWGSEQCIRARSGLHAQGFKNLKCDFLGRNSFLESSSQMPRIWLDYCEFLVNQGLITRTRRTFDRALRALPITQHHRIWPLYLKFVKRHDIPETAVRVYRRFIKVRQARGAEWSNVRSLLNVPVCPVCFSFNLKSRKSSSSFCCRSIASTKQLYDSLTSSTARISFRRKESPSTR